MGTVNWTLANVAKMKAALAEADDETAHLRGTVKCSQCGSEHEGLMPIDDSALEDDPPPAAQCVACGGMTGEWQEEGLMRVMSRRQAQDEG